MANKVALVYKYGHTAQVAVCAALYRLGFMVEERNARFFRAEEKEKCGTVVVFGCNNLAISIATSYAAAKEPPEIIWIDSPENPPVSGFIAVAGASEQNMAQALVQAINEYRAGAALRNQSKSNLVSPDDAQALWNQLSEGGGSTNDMLKQFGKQDFFEALRTRSMAAGMKREELREAIEGAENVEGIVALAQRLKVVDAEALLKIMQVQAIKINEAK